MEAICTLLGTIAFLLFVAVLVHGWPWQKTIIYQQCDCEEEELEPGDI